MAEDLVAKIASELHLSPGQVRGTTDLLDGGATVPFVARYRKEATGSLDEVAVTAIRDRLAQLREMEKRRAVILKGLEERGQLTDDLRARIVAADSMAALEDVYLPYRPKRRTRATVARERGLEPLAHLILDQGDVDPVSEAEAYVDPDKGVESEEDALAGARDIIAEWVSEDSGARSVMRDLFSTRGQIRSSARRGRDAEAGGYPEATKYKDYDGWSEPVAKAPSHRLLAMMRGAREGHLTLHALPEEDGALADLDELFVRGHGPASREVVSAIKDGYRRLLAPSMEAEVLGLAKERADQKAVSVFAENLRDLLLAPPLGSKNVLAVDPGFRTGCKVVVLDSQGTPVHHETVYPHMTSSGSRGGGAKGAAETVVALCERFGVEVIALGNGTASRETEAFLRSLDYPRTIPVVVVSEAGASVYSASEVARDEFPEMDLTFRGAVSIGRRLMDPLAELVKIDPKSLGVGQYQHDVDQKALREKLHDVATSCVNAVGVDLNTASKELFSYVSGLGPSLASKIVEYRAEHGPFRSRKELLAVPRLGPKAFEQAAGFLRIRGAKNPLDASAVHPESYGIVRAMAEDLGVSVRALVEDVSLQERVDLSGYVTDQVGLPTLEDIMEELSRPGRDPRDRFEPFEFAEVLGLEDLRKGMVLPGIVTNVTAFGAFVDVGVHQDGLVHISQLSDGFVRDPGEVVKVGRRVKVTVLEVDLERRRISLSMRTNPTTV